MAEECKVKREQIQYNSSYEKDNDSIDEDELGCGDIDELMDS